MLTEVQRVTPDDIGVLKGIGRALLLGKAAARSTEGVRASAAVGPEQRSSEEDVGIAFLESGQVEKAASHLERALELDPLLLSAATALQEVYRKQGHDEKAAALADQIRRRMR